MPKPTSPIDPLEGQPFALAGRMVCMDDRFTDIPDGVLYTEKGSIVAVQKKNDPPPPGFEGIPVLDTKGTVFPGLIELHNHLPYNILRLWDVPKKYEHRGIWAGSEEYSMNVVWPMKVIAKSAGMVPAVARYTECKCLTAGVTTSQGIRLYSDARAPGYYKGIVRNVEQTHQTDLPGADTRVADMDARELESFYRRLLASTCFLLHLCEGVGDTTRSKFTLLQFPDGKWAIERQLAGIHCVGLADRDFDVMAAEKGAMVWSPLSNLLLYGETARFRKALESGVRLGLGSDWSPSGSKNLLGELKVVQALCRSLTGMNDRDIVRMATLGAAEILAWNGVIGSLESGKRADLMVIDGTPKDSYGALIRAKETDVRLVMINGVRRYGVPSLMRQAGRPLERILVGGEARDLFLKQAVQDPKVAALSLGEAERQLRTALRQLPNLAAKLEKGPSKPKTKSRFGSFDPNSPPVWHLALDEIEDTGVDVRLRLPAGLTGEVPPSMRVSRAPKKPLSQLLKPLTLDPLTVADDDEYLDRLDRQMNLPDDVKSALKEAYG